MTPLNILQSANGRSPAICKSRNGESGNGMRGMRGMRVGMQRIGGECGESGREYGECG